MSRKVLLVAFVLLALLVVVAPVMAGPPVGFAATACTCDMNHSEEVYWLSGHADVRSVHHDGHQDIKNVRSDHPLLNGDSLVRVGFTQDLQTGAMDFNGSFRLDVAGVDGAWVGHWDSSGKMVAEGIGALAGLHFEADFADVLPSTVQSSCGAEQPMLARVLSGVVYGEPEA